MAEPDDAAEKAESVDTGALVDTESAARKLDAEEVEDIDGQDAAADDAKDVADQDTENRTRQWFSGTRGLIAASVAAIVALLGVGGWLGYRLDEDHQVQSQRDLYVQVARQTAVNLTTINYSDVDADIKRVLDSATGGFHDEFQDRSQPFAEVVKKVQSKTKGTIAESALLSYTKDQAQVLVAVAVKTSMAGALADQEPRRWRMRLTVDKAGDGAKVSNVEFVP
jgi:Mce-associated membrane protein